MAQNISYSPWENIKGPWLCLMTALLLFSLLGLFSFVSVFLTSLIKLIKPVKFFTGKRQAEDTVGGSEGIEWARTIWSCSVLLSESEKVAQSSPTLWDPMHCSPWNSPGQNTGVGSLSLLQGNLPNQGSNPGLPNCKWILYQLRHKGSPRVLEWVAYPFARGSSRPRNRTRVSCIAGAFFTNWAMNWHPTPSWEQIRCCLLCSCTENDEECYKDKYCLKFLDLYTQNNTQEPPSLSLVDSPSLPFSLPFQASPTHLKPSQTHLSNPEPPH